MHIIIIRAPDHFWNFLPHLSIVWNDEACLKRHKENGVVSVK